MEKEDVNLKSNKISESLISNALFVFLIPIISYILSYGFNWGYNSYFGMPAYLTSYSFTPILNNFASFLMFFLVILFVLFFLNFFNNIIKSSNKPLYKLVNKIPTIISYLFLIIVSLSLIITKSFGGVIIIIIMLIIHFYIYRNSNKALELNNKIANYDPSTDSAQEELRNITHQFNQIKEKSNIPFIYNFYTVAIIISFLLALFNIMYVFGAYTAEHQNTFYSLDNNSIVINTLNDNYITIPIYKKDSSYYFKSEYTLTPMSDASIKLKHITNLTPNENVKKIIPF